MRRVLLLACVCACNAAYSQKVPVKYGDVTLPELQLTHCPYDSTAPAMVLMDFGNAAIVFSKDQGFQLLFTRVTRIKILSVDGYDYANFTIPLYHENDLRETVSGLKGSTYNLVNGKIEETKLGKEGSFTERFDANRDNMKVTLPNVKVGSVVELSYKVTSDYLVDFEDWEFQWDIPVIHSEFWASIPEYFHYDRYMQGYVGLSMNKQSEGSEDLVFTEFDHSAYVRNTSMSTQTVLMHKTNYFWAADNVPAFRAEPFITTVRDYVSAIRFELAYVEYPGEGRKPVLGTWQQIDSKLWSFDDFGGAVKGNGFLGKIADAVTAGITDPTQKAQALIAYVKSNVDWNGVNTLFADDIKHAFDTKSGSSAEINLALVVLFNKAGLAADPVITSTRTHGMVRDFVPELSQFNYVLCQANVDGKKLLIDGTENLLPYDMLPMRCLNAKGYLINGAGGAWVDIIPSERSKTVTSASLTLSDDGGLQGSVKFSHEGYDAFDHRSEYKDRGSENYLKDLETRLLWSIDSSAIEDVSPSTPFSESYSITIPDAATVAGPMIYFNPFVAMHVEDNPFKLEDRQYPVNFGTPLTKVYLLNFQVPEGYSIEEIPKSQILTLPNNDCKFVFNVSQVGNSIAINGTLTVNKPVFLQTEYASLRHFYDLVIAKEGEQIVLKKN